MNEYRSQLDSQVRRAQDTLKEVRGRREKMEKEERKDLAKRFVQVDGLCSYYYVLYRLNALEQAYMKEKAARVAEYRKALAAQVYLASCWENRTY